MSRYGRIERGHMAADRFTQVSNELVRDRRLTRKARGLFVEIASHRSNFGLTVESLVRTGPEGRDAIMTGLKELETYGYLERHQERDEQGRLGAVVYRITDSPIRPDSRQSPRSEPMSENPTSGEPTSADPETKKTKIKKTTSQKTQPSPPAAPGRSPATKAPGRKGRAKLSAKPSAASSPKRRAKAPEAPPASLGVSMLLKIGAADRRLAIGGDALARLGKQLDVLLTAGWAPTDLRAALTGGLPPEVTSPAGFIARRMAAVPLAPTVVPAPSPAVSPGGTTYTPPRFGEHVGTPPIPECEDCGVPPVPGYGRCAACMDWPYCEGCQRRRTMPGGNGLCRTCDEGEREWQTATDAFNALLEEPR